jgi:hypothetical protein
MIAVESERLTIRELTAEDLPLLMPVHLSKPEFLALVEGSEGEAGRYDLARWRIPRGRRGARRPPPRARRRRGPRRNRPPAAHPSCERRESYPAR